MIDPNDKPTVLERLHSAIQSSDLTLRPRGVGDADHLVALGLAAKEAGAAAGELMFLHIGGTQTGYRRARDAVLGLARKMNGVRNWRLNAANTHRAAELALAHHVNPACPHCHGRGKLVAEGTPFLTANLCKHCHGTGKRRVQRKLHREITELIEALARLDRTTESSVARRLH
jgi:hypothetical protein